LDIFVRIFKFPSYILPAPIDVIIAGFKYYRTILGALSWTLYEALMGYGISIVIGLPLGILIVYSKFSKDYIMPLLVMTNSVPKSALAPLFLLWAGYGSLSKILISFLMAFFPIVINTAVGLYRIDEYKINLVKCLNGTQIQIFTKIRLPNALPSIFAGLKLSITLALIGAVVGEFVGGNEGIGVLILMASTEIKTAIVFACIIVLSLVGILLFYGVEFVQKKAVPWYHEGSESN
jgi:NitT/TauT family transport system permease protein